MIATSYMFLVDEDIGDGRLAGLLSKVVLDLAAVRGLVEPECYDQLGRQLRMEMERTP